MFLARKDGILFSLVISINHSVVKWLRCVKLPAGNPCELFFTLAPALLNVGAFKNKFISFL